MIYQRGQLRDLYANLTVALELFPRCASCGRDLSREPLTRLLVSLDRPNRFTCKECPPGVDDAA